MFDFCGQDLLRSREIDKLSASKCFFIRTNQLKQRNREFGIFCNIARDRRERTNFKIKYAQTSARYGAKKISCLYTKWPVLRIKV